MTEAAEHPADLRDPAGGAKLLSPDTFKEIFRFHPAGVAVITFQGPSGPGGFTATSVISVSADPPYFAFSVAAGSTAYLALRRTDRVVINFLAAHQAAVAGQFAARGVDRFAGADWTALPGGEPVIPGTTAWLLGRIVQRVPAGASLLVVAAAEAAARNPLVRPLVYEDRTFRHLGGPAG